MAEKWTIDQSRQLRNLFRFYQKMDLSTRPEVAFVKSKIAMFSIIQAYKGIIDRQKIIDMVGRKRDSNRISLALRARFYSGYLK